MEITSNNKSGSLDNYLEGLKQRIPSLATRPTTRQAVDMTAEAAMLKRCLDEVCTSGRFDIDTDKRDIVNSIFAWIWKRDKWNKCNLDYRKGLFLYGPVGTGKSTFLKGVQRYMNTIRARDLEKDYRIGFWWKSASELANSYAGNGQEKLLQWCDDCNLLIDELGREPRPAKHYGTELNVIQFLLQLRYDKRMENVTHITSNINPQDVMELYGDYISDRFREMFNIIPWFGNSKRQTK